MKKRVLSALLVVFLLVGAVVPVSAEEYITQDGEVSVPVTYDIQSSYVINIPASIDLSGLNTYTFTASMVSIPDTQEVSIYAPENGVKMTNEYGNTGTMYMRAYGVTGVDDGRVASFGRGDTTSKFPMSAQFDEMSSGHFTGTATFTVRLENKK